MVLGMLILLVLSSVYFTRLLTKKRMCFAAIGVVLLCCIFLCWGAVVLSFDFEAPVAAGPSSNHPLNSKDLADLFANISAILPLTMQPVIRALFIVVSLIIVASVVAAIHGSIIIGREIAQYVKSVDPSTSRFLPSINNKNTNHPLNISILRLHCRLNC